jgi:hypothetical protein
LADDLDFDGRPDLTMQDDGTGADEMAGDGVYSAAADEGVIHLVWTIRPDRSGLLHLAGSVSILVRASFPAGKGPRREIRLGTLRANPRYVGTR